MVVVFVVFVLTSIAAIAAAQVFFSGAGLKL